MYDLNEYVTRTMSDQTAIYTIWLWGKLQRRTLHGTVAIALFILLIEIPFGGWIGYGSVAIAVALGALALMIVFLTLTIRALRVRHVWMVHDGIIDTGHGSVPLADIDRIDANVRSSRLELVLKNGERRAALTPTMLAKGRLLVASAFLAIAASMNHELHPFTHPDAHE